jgi:hypothetical protein
MILVTGGTGLVGCILLHITRHPITDSLGYVLLIDLLVLLKKPNRYLTAIIRDLFDKDRMGPSRYS